MQEKTYQFFLFQIAYFNEWEAVTFYWLNIAVARAEGSLFSIFSHCSISRQYAVCSYYAVIIWHGFIVKRWGWVDSMLNNYFYMER